MLKSIILYLAASVVAKTYTGYSILEAKIESETSLAVLTSLEQDAIIDLWDQHKGPVLFSVSSRNLKTVKKVLHQQSIPFQTVGDLGEMIEIENSQQSLTDPDYFSKYRKIDEINEYIDKLVAENGGLVSKFSVGKSYKNKEIYGIKIRGNGTRDRSAAQSVVFHGGIHAREWIGPAVVTYMATQLVQNYKINPNITKLVDRFDFHIIPVLNVDGYAFTHDKDRMWRKNRQPNGGGWCTGIDLNRNFDSGWGKPGASSNPCSEAYRGPKAFTAVETQRIAAYIEETKPLVYIDFHAYSQLLMYPWGWNCDEDVPNKPELQRVADITANALYGVHGTKFTTGGICKTIYQASGSSIDWAYEHSGVQYPFAVELRDTGRFGFMLPANQIVPSGEETMAGLVAMLSAI